jgi:predicted DNA-binding transcriptional regulator AlpA
MPIIARYPTGVRKTIDVDSLHTKPTLTVAEVALLLGYSRWTIIRLFENEPGVLIRRHPEKMHKRGRRAIRIPRAVYLRVRAKMGQSPDFQ